MNKILMLCFALVSLSACSELELGSYFAKQITSSENAQQTSGDFKVGNPYKVKGRVYSPQEQYHYSETGIASWYGPGFHGKKTANGEIFNKNELTAAHKTLQMPSIVRVTNLDNGRSIIVRVNDRGPFSDDRIIDLSEKAAEVLDMKRSGTARVRIDVMEKESRQVASAAKKGISTRGTELALNRGHDLHPEMDMVIAKPVSKPFTPQRLAMQNSPPVKTKTFENILINQAYAEPVRKPLYPSEQQDITKNIFIQTHTFTNEDNALTFKNSLYNISEPVHVYRIVEHGQPLYQVKIGPVKSVEQANEIARRLSKQGREAKVVVTNY